jgi:hypothetical protein
MTIWCVYFKDKYEGLYIAAPTCAAAKEKFQERYGTERPIRAMHVKNVGKTHFPSTAVLSPGDPRLSMFGLRYADVSESG